ncbi:hypothetical protein OAA62_00195 [bacterium]|nr:hypothetical protein [bacterium]
MKLKLTSLLLALGLMTNAATAGNSAKIGYASDFFYRGEQKAVESIQSSVDLEAPVLGLDGKLHACTNQSIDEGVDSYRFAAGLGADFAKDLFSIYGGFNHFEDVAGEALSEIELSGSVNVFGNPTLSAFRNVDEDLYTFEGSLSESFDLSFASLSARGSVGNTEVTTANDRTYYSIGGGLSRQIGAGVDLSLSVDLIDSDDIEREFVFGTALAFSF